MYIKHTIGTITYIYQERTDMKEKLLKVDQDVHRMIKAQAAKHGMTMKSYLRKLAYENMEK